MTTTTITPDPSDIADFDRLWATAAARAPFSSSNLADFLDHVDAKEALIARQTTDPDAGPILPFVRTEIDHRFAIAERGIGRMRLPGLYLSTPWLAEGHSPQTVAALLRAALSDRQTQVIGLGELPNDSTLRRALDHLPPSLNLRPMRLNRKDSLRWLIRLPESFDSYLSGLSKGTRQSVRRKMRKLDQSFDVRIDIVSEADDATIRHFLTEGERISRMTYQWNVGQRLINDNETFTAFRKLAEAGRLRCYLLSLDGKPCAFLRGTVDGRFYSYETPGFDPEYGSFSIGLVILLEAIRDLIENTDVEVFDFGTGGDTTGYKSSFGTENLPCNSWLLVRATRPRAMALLATEAILTAAKNIADRILPSGDIRDKIKQRLRKYGS